MQRFLMLMVFISAMKPIKAQNSFSFNCAKDTIIQCTTSCITLSTTLPDIHALTNTYTVNQISALSCFRGYVDPAASGPSANLTIDDRYSPVLDITFPFSFFGSVYNKLIASTNGFLSFDISKTLLFSHFGILRKGGSLSATSGTPEDLPSLLYDKALIMGPYHDLDPNNSLSTQQIKYEVIGNAPYRKWILSYYNVPLYTTACLNLSKNTHQIVLYETLGIVEIFIYDKEICLNWNNGRAMIGMQDFNKSSFIMPPGRQASSTPWGSKGMNESWRFVPASGSSLFKKVELYTLSGTFVTTGTVAPAPNNLFTVAFNNVCPPPTGQTYVVKSFYKNPNNLSAEIVGTDTINVSRGDPIIADLTSAKCAQNSKGRITITSPVGNYEYSIDGNNWQTSNIFDLPSGSYTVRSRIIGTSCISSKKFTIDIESFEANIKIIITPCPPPLSAYIQIFPYNGSPPYLYSLNGGALQTSNTFTGLVEGNYKVFVQDANGCTYTTIISIVNANLATASVTNTICGKAPSGSIVVTPGFGFSPYNYSINGGPFQPSNIFNNLPAGSYNIIVRDSSGCTYALQSIITPDVLLNANPVIKMPACFGDINGSITVHPSLGVSPYQFALNGNSYQSDSVFTNLSAGNYMLHIKDSSGCAKDTSVLVPQPNPVNGTAVITPAATCLSFDGQVTVKANGGVVPYIFSIDDGNTYQASNVFDVQAGTFKIIIKDSNSCKSKITDTVPAMNKSITVDTGPDKTICVGSSTILSATSTRPVNIFSWSPSAGLNDSTSATPLANPLDTTTYILTAKSEVCQGSDTITVNVLHKPVANAGADSIICYNSSATLHGSATNTSGSVSYSWLPSNEMVTPNSATTIVWPKDIRAHTYKLQVADNYGCNFKVYDDIVITMNGPVKAFAGNDTIAAAGLPHQLSGSGGIKYLWSPPDVLNNPTAQNPVAILQKDTRFYLTVTDTLGCIGESSVFVKVYYGATYYIPNAFTPNGDGLNDIFKAIAPGIQQTDYFRIYNRLGQLIFQSQDVTKGWDGKYMGVPQPAAVYVWTIKGKNIKSETVVMKGIVTLIR